MNSDPLSFFLQSVLREGTVALALFVALLLAAFWIYQFIQLMTLSDDQFPGKFDKPCWVAGLLVGNIAGAIAFWLWKHLFREQPSATGRRFAPNPDFLPDLGETPAAK